MQDHTPEVPATHKRCRGCQQVKPFPEFHRNKNSSDGRNATCKQCRAVREGFGYRPPTQEGYRRCNRCKKEFPADLDHFYADRRYAGVFSAWCISCTKENVAEWAKQNREKTRKTKRKWNAGNVEKRRAIRVRAYTRDIERSRAKGREYRRAMYRNNPDVARAIAERRRARKLNAEGTHTADDIKRQYKAQRGKCYYCGVKVGKKYHVDHVIPLSRGGSNGPENIVIACPSCNQCKNDKLPHEWPQGNRLL